MTTYSTGNPVGSGDPRDFYDNSENLDAATNSRSAEWTDRLGNKRPTIAGAIDPTGLAQAAASSAQEAESARDSAFVNAEVYATVDAGLSETLDQEQFQVVEGEDIVRYRNDAGSAVEVARYPSAYTLTTDRDSSVIYKVVDRKGSLILAIFNDGGFLIPGLEGETLQDLLFSLFDKTKQGVFKIKDIAGDVLVDITDAGDIYIPGVGASLQSVLMSGLNYKRKAPELTYSARLFLGAPSVRLDETHDSPLSQRVPSAAVTGNRHWCCWYSNDLIASEGGGDYVNIAYSDDDWDTSIEFAHIAFDSSNDRAFDPQMWLDSNGYLWIFFAVGGNNTIRDGVSGAWAVTVKNPESQFPIFSTPFEINPVGIPMQPRFIDEQVYLPIDNWLVGSAKYPNFGASRVFNLRTDYRVTEKLFVVPPAPADIFDVYVETNIAQLNDGSLIAGVRTSDGAYISRSTDGGETWSTPERWAALGLSDPASRFWFNMSPTGRLCVAYNAGPGRTNMTLAFSEDGGETFPFSVLLDDRSNISYPTVYFSGDDVYVVYDRNRTTDKEIIVAITSESDVVAATAIPLLKIVSSK